MCILAGVYINRISNSSEDGSEWEIMNLFDPLKVVKIDGGEYFRTNDEVHDTNLCNCFPLRLFTSGCFDVGHSAAFGWLVTQDSLPSFRARRLSGKQKSLIILYCTWFAVHSLLIAFWLALLVKWVHKNAIYRLINHQVIVAVYKYLNIIKNHFARRSHSYVCRLNYSGTCDVCYPPPSMSLAFMNNRTSRMEFH